MKRREFVVLLAGGAAIWPLAARAQQPSLPVIGFLGSAAPTYDTHLLAAFRQGLAEAGFVEGRNVAIEVRWAEGHYERLPQLAAELIQRKVSLIMAGALPSTLAAKAATTTIPIIFAMGADPVKFGVVASLGRPGGNITGVSNFYGALGAKRLEMLSELVPGAGLIGVLSNRNNPNAESHLNDIRSAAKALGKRIEIVNAGTESQLDAAFATFARMRIRAVLLADDPFFSVQRKRIADLAARHRLPTAYYTRDFAQVGGLISYGSSTSENYRQAGLYAGRILKGDKPADLPVLQPTKFELVINRKTAKALGLAIPRELLLRADEVIE